jgi:outer membrane protein OmpA-like peptidoglycan-associated protein
MQRLPLHALVAYGGTLPVEVVRAELGLQTQSQVRLLPAGLSAQVQGDVRLTDVMVRTPTTALRAGDELLSWQALGLSGLRVVLAPGQLPQVDLTQGSLSDFYARLLITEQGQLNLNDLRPPAAAASAASAAAPAQSASQAASPASPASSANGLPLKLQVAGLKLSNGRVDFTDRFIRPNYSAALSELNGSFGRFGTEVVEAAPLLLNGKVAGTGLLNIQGSLNPLARPLALDVQASARDLELAPLTPYSAKYAGLPIERGKLSVDVRYRIAPDGQLKASNQVVLNQLTFGDAVDSPDATKLPVRLAVALLTDRHGVIDVNLPVSGSINDPQFSIGGVVLKVIGNLIVKAVTAPFSLLMGESSADSLSQVQFEPGTTRMRGDAEQALNRIAEALNNRPALKMTVTGAADPQTEREAIQHTWLEERLLAERRQELLRAGAPMDAPVPALGAPDRERLLRRLQSALRTAKQLGPFSQPTPAQLEAELKASHLVTADSARELALQRGLAVRDALIARGLARERLFLAAPRLRLAEGDENASGGAQSNAQSNAQSSAPSSAPSDAAWSPSVQLSLGTN